MNKLGGLKSHSAAPAKGGPLANKPDTSGGYMESGPTGRSVPCSKGGSVTPAMVDGPFGGKVKA